LISELSGPDFLTEFSKRCISHGKLFEAQIELTHRCNLRCIHCYVPQASLPQEIGLETWKAVIDHLVDMGLCVLTLTGGEPLLYQKVKAVIAHAFSKGCQVRLFSNATLINSPESAGELKQVGLCYLETSLYGANAEVHDRITGIRGSFQRTLDAVRWVNEVSLPVTVKTSWLKQNWKEYPSIVDLVRQLGVYFRGSPNIMPRLDGDPSNQQNRMSLEELIEFYRMDRGDEVTDHCPSKGKDLDSPPCGIARTGMTINPAGDAYPCLHMRVPFANVLEGDLAGSWANAPLLKHLRSLTRKSFTACEGCSTRPYCFVCMADGWQEWKDPSRPSSETCLLGKARQAAG
jgi:radical SAM protein with 4Fe4S-binding SPASM domain